MAAILQLLADLATGVALLAIPVLALFLAVSEMLGKSSQTKALALNIEASDTWAFFQAKTIRQTVLRAAVEGIKVQSPDQKPEVAKQMADWQATIDRWESEPKTNEGRKELMQRAKGLEQKRETLFEQYHAYEVASLLIQLGIVMASVSLLSSVMMFAFGSLALGAVGLFVVLDTYFHWHMLTSLLH